MSTTILTFEQTQYAKVYSRDFGEKAGDNCSQNQKQGSDITSRVSPDGINLMILNS
jgi:hypothetical protein